MNPFVQSQFGSRLLFLGGLMALAGLGLFGRLAQLTVFKGSSLRADAEQRLSREVWTPTVRGSILDRKGRVLAQDRPAYDIQLDYSVIDGSWASRQARRAAIRMAGSRWADIGKPGQAELIGEIQPQYEAHVANARRLLANTLGITQQEFDDRINTIVTTVERRQQAVTRARLDNRMREAREKNTEVTEAMLRKFERDAAEPIEDKIRSHVIARGAQDAVGFAARRLASESVDIALSAADASEKFQLAADRVETVPIVPGLSVTDSNQREYPLEHQVITLDTSLYPSVLRDSPVTVDIDGVGQLLIGKLRNQVFGDRTDGKGRTLLGDTNRRVAFLKENPSLAERALLPTDGDLPKIDRGAYREGDRIGDTGVEASQEHWLRGLRGLQTTRLESGDISTIDSTPGRSVQLTIDAVLQAKLQALLSPHAGLAQVQPWHFSASSPQQDIGQELYGGAVVVEIATGDILAAASSPTISREQLAQDPSLATDELRRPFFNRAFASEYPPGSIVKPIILCEAAKRGLVRQGEHIACTGHYLANNPNVLRCLIFKTYGLTHSQRLNHDPSPVEAIGVSCNIFFYTMGDRLGADGVRAAYQSYGVGERFALGAGFEAPGSLGTNGPSSISNDDAIQMGIGQGPVTWTALHAANAYATIARNGQYLKPRIVITDDVRPPARDMGYPPHAISEAMQGLWFAINDPAGSGHHLGGVLERERIFTVPGVKIWGKTGTAAAPDLRIDPDGDGPLDPQVVRSGDHSWFVVLAGKDRPQFAIAVVVEYGGSGGKVSGPIVNQIVKALVDEELM